MSEQKVEALEGAALDWAVAKAVGQVWLNNDGGYGAAMGWLYSLTKHGDPVWSKLSGFRPSTDWNQGGPLIEKHKVATNLVPSGWAALTLDDDGDESEQNGRTPLIAAMRAIVRSELGDTVQVPVDLVEVRRA